MLIADVDGVRSLATATGQRGRCPCCDGEVISKCGQIMVHHWALRSVASGGHDSWYEPETEWHREWKTAVAGGDLSRIEVSIREGDKRHQADAICGDGWVCEVQHSNISPQEMTEREDFYTRNCGGMVWVFDYTKGPMHTARLSCVNLNTAYLIDFGETTVCRFRDSSSLYASALAGIPTQPDANRVWSGSTSEAQRKILWGQGGSYFQRLVDREIDRRRAEAERVLALQRAAAEAKAAQDAAHNARVQVEQDRLLANRRRAEAQSVVAREQRAAAESITLAYAKLVSLPSLPDPKDYPTIFRGDREDPRKIPKEVLRVVGPYLHSSVRQLMFALVKRKRGERLSIEEGAAIVDFEIENLLEDSE